jgi:hypothetical protein
MRNVGVRFGFVQRIKGQTAGGRSTYQTFGFVGGSTPKVYSGPSNRHVFHGLFLPATAPSWARDKRNLWDQASAAERRMDAVEGRTLEVSLPRALPQEAAIEAMEKLALWFAELGVAVQLDVHDSPANDGERNPHAHFLISTREMSERGFEPKKSKVLNDVFGTRKGRWMHEQVASIINSAALKRIGQEVVYSGPGPRMGLPEPRLPRWAAKTAEGKRFLTLNREVKNLPALYDLVDRAEKAVFEIADTIGDLDWWVSGYLGRLPSHKQLDAWAREAESRVARLRDEAERHFEIDREEADFLDRDSSTVDVDIDIDAYPDEAILPDDQPDEPDEPDEHEPDQWDDLEPDAY